MNKENEPKIKFKTGQIVRGGRVDGFWFLTNGGRLFIGSGDYVREVEPREIDPKSLKNFPSHKIEN